MFENKIQQEEDNKDNKNQLIFIFLVYLHLS